MSASRLYIEEVTVPMLLESINSLQEPYRRNALIWLEGCFDHPIDDPETDLEQCVDELNPRLRDWLMFHAHKVLQGATMYFGRPA
jgi:hypothetical protein